MGTAHIFFLNKTAAPATAPAAPVSVRVPTAPVLFVKAITPASETPPQPARVPDPASEFDPGMDCNRPMTGYMFDLVCKALHDNKITVSEAAHANDAYLAGRVLPTGLIKLVVARSAPSPSGA
jgi:hypothetical protein